MDPDLLKRYLDGKCSPEETKAVEHWYRHIEYRGIPPELDQVMHLSKIKKEILKTEGRKNNFYRKPWHHFTRRRAFMMAASVLLIASLGASLIWFKKGTPDQQMVAANTTVLANTLPRIVKYQLPDSSYVWLHPKSELTYENTAFRSSARKVRLTGQAFFDITRNTESPFVVEVGNMRVKVLGTSFLVRPGTSHADYEVAVVSGKVQVYAETGNDPQNTPPVVLSPSEKASFHLPTGSVTASKISSSDVQVETWQPANLLFDDTSLAEVAKQLELKFGMEVSFEDSALANCLLKASFENHRLVEVLDAMSEMLELNYEMGDKNVLLKGQGCPKNL